MFHVNINLYPHDFLHCAAASRLDNCIKHTGIPIKVDGECMFHVTYQISMTPEMAVPVRALLHKLPDHHHKHFNVHLSGHIVQTINNLDDY